jgi:hypothetical protein
MYSGSRLVCACMSGDSETSETSGVADSSDLVEDAWVTVESSESAEAVGDGERGRLLTGCGGGGGSDILGTFGVGSVILGGGGGSVILIGGVVCREDGFAALGDRRITVVVLVVDSACIGGARGDGFF